MKRRNLIGLYLTICIVSLLSSLFAHAASQTFSSASSPDTTAKSHKVLFVNSYHWGYQWSDIITQSIADVFTAKLSSEGHIISTSGDIALRVYYMDTKRKTSEKYKKREALKIRSIIEQWQPDVVITSDDNAAKYLIAPYFIDSSLPFVFCGVNWDSSDYGLPSSNVTGMLEVQLIDQLLQTMRRYSKGNKIAFLKGDDLSARKEALQFEKHFGISLEKKFVATFTEWKKQYISLQTQTDMLLLGNPASISQWDDLEARKVIYEHTNIPTGNWDAWMAPLTLVTFATKPREQGEWAAETTLSILAGKSPADIPTQKNTTAHVYLNMGLAKKLGIIFPMELINRATFTGN